VKYLLVSEYLNKARLRSAEVYGVKLSPKVSQAVKWYAQNRALYDALARKVETIVREIVQSNNINFHSISNRAKKISSYRKKASREEYKEPRSEIMDMAGIRIITYTDSEAKKVSEIVKKTFRIYPEHSVNKTEELGVDKVGYRGIHYIADLGEDRLKLPENAIFKEHVFEIQIRSILQHAWAEFEHDRNYKFSGILPKDIRRRLSLVAGTLESVDREFDSLSEAIDNYASNVELRIKSGDLRLPINSTSLKTYMNTKFKPLVEEGIINPTFDSDIIQELSDMGISTLEELDHKIPEDIMEKIRLHYPPIDPYQQTFLGILRDILILCDADAYFSKAWKNKWQGIDNSAVSFLLSYGINIRKHIKIYGLDIY